MLALLDSSGVWYPQAPGSFWDPRMPQRWVQERHSRDLINRPPGARTAKKGMKDTKHLLQFEALVLRLRSKLALEPFQLVLVTRGPGLSTAC
jgi:hypothetical protein